MTASATNTILTLFVLTGLGVALKRLKVTDLRTDNFLSVFLVSYVIPANMVYTTYTSFTIEHLRVSYKGVLIAMASMLLLVVISLGLSRLRRHNNKRGGSFIAMGAFSNTIFIGLPIITSLFGDAGVPYLLLFFLANTILFWSVGNYFLAKARTGSTFSLGSLLKIINPAIIGFMVGLLILYYNIHIPAYLDSSLGYLKDLITPLSLIYMGSMIGSLSFSNLGSPVDTVLIVLLRFLVAPVIMIVIFFFFPMPDLMEKVFVVCAGLPVMGSVSIVAGRYGGDAGYASFMTALTTFLSLFAIPLYFILFQFL